MIHEVCVKGDSRDGPAGVTQGNEADRRYDGTRGIERGEGAVGSAQEAVIHRRSRQSSRP